MLPRWVVTRVCEVPGGAKPSYAQDYYDRDNDAYKAWDAVSQGPRAVRRVAGERCELRSRRDDERRRRPRADGRQRLLRRASACRAPARTSPAARTRPDLVLVYEAGAIGAKPPRLPLSIGDGMLGETADAVVGVPEIFNYWVQPGRIDVGFLGAAQIDRFANINTTVIGGDYDHPKVRLPGAGGAPEIAASCGEVIVIVRQSTARVRGEGRLRHLGRPRRRAGRRARSSACAARARREVITDLGILEPDPETSELVAHHAAPGRRPPSRRGRRRAGS